MKTEELKYLRSVRVNLTRLSILDPLTAQPFPTFTVMTDGSGEYIQISTSREDKGLRCSVGQMDSKGSTTFKPQDHTSSATTEDLLCVACQSPGAARVCDQCGVAFHDNCHIPPITNKTDCEGWVCLLCELAIETKSLEQRKKILSPQNHEKCKKLLGHLRDDSFLIPSVTKRRPKSSRFDLIWHRLLGKSKPNYQTVDEVVSDIWAIFDVWLLDEHNSERKSHVISLQESFKVHLNNFFGSNHPSTLLRRSSDDPAGNAKLILK